MSSGKCQQFCPGLDVLRDVLVTLQLSEFEGFSVFLIDSDWYRYAPANYAIIGIYNGLVPVRYRVIISTSAGLS